MIFLNKSLSINLRVVAKFGLEFSVHNILDRFKTKRKTVVTYLASALVWVVEEEAF